MVCISDLIGQSQPELTSELVAHVIWGWVLVHLSSKVVTSAEVLKAKSFDHLSRGIEKK